MNKILIGIAVLATIIAAIFFYSPSRQPVTPSPVPIATSTGTSGTPPSATDTIPPAPPTHVEKGMVKGTVILGPTCPVERIPPDPNCADKPYQTTIRIQPANPSAPYTTISTDASGTFSVSLDPGTYTFQPVGGNSMPPTCRQTQVVVAAGQTQTVSLDCDTGIR